MSNSIGDDEIYDYLDIDCADCGVKFFVRPLSNKDKKNGKEYSVVCRKCAKAILDIAENYHACNYCGSDIPNDQWECPNCHAV